MCGGRGVGRGEGGWWVNNRMFVPPPGHWGHSADLAGVIAHSAGPPQLYHSALSKLLCCSLSNFFVLTVDIGTLCAAVLLCTF